eukprot:6490347-Amphidinium_carterae.1
MSILHLGMKEVCRNMKSRHLQRVNRQPCRGCTPILVIQTYTHSCVVFVLEVSEGRCELGYATSSLARHATRGDQGCSEGLHT